MKKLFLVLAFITFIFLSFPCFGLQEARPIAQNSQIKVMNYNSQGIHKYVGFYGYQSSILFEIGEEIETISMGDSSGWQLSPQDNRLFIKPIADNANTNATIITNKRVYFFELHAEESTGLDDLRLAYEVRFIYPTSESYDSSSGNIVAPATNQVGVPDISDPDVAKKGLNFNYSVSNTRGSSKIVPLKVFDDGRFTYLQFPVINADLPSIFYVDSDGYESLINFRIIEDYVVIERVGSVFAVLHGSDTVCLFNENMPFTKPKKRKVLFG